MFKFNKTSILSTLAVAAAGTLVAGAAMAGADATFDPIVNTVMGWLGGSLGKLLAGVFVIIGLVAGAARGSILAFAVGIGCAVGVANIDTILSGIVGSTLEAAPAVTQALMLTNGL